jgi:D-tyrosyl-tRNA(Tyr) deacylase
MRIVMQRVHRARVAVAEAVVAEIGRGLLILLGIESGDTAAEADALAEKCAYLRIFDDADGKPNLSVQDVRGEALVVSQFTLCADTRKGRRPSYAGAAAPEIAAPLVDHFARRLSGCGVPTRQGVFGAHMMVELVNDGPFTIVLNAVADNP